MPPGGHQRQGGKRLPLTAGGDQELLLGRQLQQFLDVHDVVLRDLEQSQLLAHCGVAMHGTPEEGHLPAVGNGGVGDLLHPVDVTGETGGDHAPGGGTHDVADGLGEGAL